ncbi:MAG TPA: hypothetical protein VI603_07000 [Saprospiraceae bacterium]|nr:hypothetical protein [Saprospiraceae bacterium]
MKLLIGYILIFALGVMSCSTPTKLGYERTGEVRCISHDNRTATFDVNTVGSSLSDATFYAEVKSFENLLYKGVPDSNQEIPLISSDKRTESTDAYFVEFFNDGIYRQFVTASDVRSHRVSDNNHFINQRITIDITAFRKHLEDQQIIRKFGQ